MSTSLNVYTSESLLNANLEISLWQQHGVLKRFSQFLVFLSNLDRDAGGGPLICGAMMMMKINKKFKKTRDVFLKHNT